MSNNFKIVIFGLLLFLVTFFILTPKPIIRSLQIFYYPWYGNPENDGKYSHWDHNIIGMDSSYIGGDEIGANFYPQLGNYSSHDEKIIDIHMRQMKSSGVDVVSVSWLGEGSYEDEIMLSILDNANKYGLLVNIHLEPFYTTIDEVYKSLEFMNTKYGAHPAIYKQNNKPLFYIYDAYKIETEQWQRLLLKDGDLSIRNTSLDGEFIGLLLDISDTTFIDEGGFDGAYSYFVSEGFTDASTINNWSILNDWADRNDKLFIPSVGPGYSDTRIRPWNIHNQKDRLNGIYYDKLFANAILSGSNIITITSFNEWHEGTQVEPSIPKSSKTFVYLDYGELGSEYYLDRTRFWADKFHSFFKLNPDEFSDNFEFINHQLIGHSYILKNNPHNKYNNNWESILTDGKLGSTQYKDGNWLGFEEEDLNVKFVLDTLTEISSIQLHFLHREDVWVFPPKSIEISISENGNYFESIYKKVLPQIIQGDGGIKSFTYDVPFYANYISLKVVNQGTCPEWHTGHGEPAWLFVDELIVK